MKKVLIALVVLIVLLVGGSYLLPGNYNVSRSSVLAAEPAAIYAPLADLQTWPEWSAWNKERDQSAEWTFAGAPGEGQTWKWQGEELGNGQLRLMQTTPDQGIAYGISMEEGKFKGDGTIKLERTGDKTKVTWTGRGKLGKNPVYRWMGLFMDGMLGKDFETSLAGLQKRVEGAAPPK